MPNLSALARRASKALSDNSPAILTATAVTGVLTTAILAVRGTIQAASDLASEGYWDRDYKFEVTNKELAQKYWKCYIPAGLSASATVAAIIASQHISSRRNAALLSVYSLTETAFKEYKDKVVEQIGEGKEQKVRDSIAQDRVTNNPPTSEVIISGKDGVLFYESFSGRYFKSSHETVRKAQNDINSMILGGEMSASLNEFNHLIGLPANGLGETVGFNVDTLVDVQFSAVMTDDKEPAICIGYAKLPIPYFHKVW